MHRNTLKRKKDSNVSAFIHEESFGDITLSYPVLNDVTTNRAWGLR